MLLGHVVQRDGHIALFGKYVSRFKPDEVARLNVATEGLAPLVVDRDYRRVLAHAGQCGAVERPGGLRAFADFVRGKCGLQPSRNIRMPLPIQELLTFTLTMRT